MNIKAQMNNDLDILLKDVRLLYEAEIDLALDRLKKLLSKLDNPHHYLPPIIHVAGTNGKGSTIAFMHSILKSIGKSCHVYTSPHLVSWCERIVINNKEVKIEKLIETLKTVVQVNNQASITIFEAFTAAAFVLFKSYTADFLLLEVGLGGEFDATNVVEQPQVSVITPISLDHQDFLGNSLSEIAHAKTGIIKPNCPVVIAPQSDIAMEVLQKKAIELNAPCFRAGYEWYLDERKLKYQDKIYQLPENMGLLGNHQYINAATAIVTLLVSDVKLSSQNIEDGLHQATWAGRLQPISLPTSKHEVWLDGAHNPAGAQAISSTLSTWRNEKPLYAIIAMKKDKDAKKFLKIIAPYMNQIIFTTCNQTDNFYDPETLFTIFNKLLTNLPTSSSGLTRGSNLDSRLRGNDSRNDTGVITWNFRWNGAIVSSWRDAIEQLQSNKRGRVLITGSLYLVGEVLSSYKT